MKPVTTEDLAAYKLKVAEAEKKLYTGEVSHASLSAYRANLTKMYHRFYRASPWMLEAPPLV